MIKLSEIKLNPDNPRKIEDAKFNKLKESITKFPKMMEIRPIVVDNKNMVLGGNMRLKALQELGYKEIPDEWVKKIEDLNSNEAKEFMIKDNISAGEWEVEALLKMFDIDKLAEWGLDDINFESFEFADEKETKKIDKDVKIILECPPKTWLLNKDQIIEELEKIVNSYGMSCNYD